MSKEKAKEKISKLIEEYERLKSNDEWKDKNEAFVKQRFIQPLFEALGWDFHKDVWPEERVSKDRADYAFKLDDFPKFFIEAKKFNVNLDDEQWAEQVIEYAWYKSVTWAILTNFIDLKLFNSEWKQKPYREIKQLNYTEYIDRFDELWLLSKEMIEVSELDKRAEEWGVKEKKINVTERLAKDLTIWRDELTTEVRELNKEKFKPAEIDEAVQRFLDRLIFIRYTEDKGFEPKRLEPLVRENKNSGRDLMPDLNKIFWQYDGWYDSRLFAKGHFSENMELYGGKLENIIYGLYRPGKDSHPYDFSAIGSDILGRVYEQYLGYIHKNGQKKSISKRKEQGIYYTRDYIVNFIVKNTLGEIINGKKKDEIKNVKILDPACGSGSFLIKIFQTLLDYYERTVEYKTESGSQMRAIEKAMLDKKGGNEISTAQKLTILRENIFGVDLDPKAVEIAQLNLLLKALTKRTKLPNLSHNIACGNSIISEGEAKYNPFNYRKEFSEVFAQGGFDIIIGNPPYIKEYTNKSVFDGLHSSPYYQGKMDIWTMFACQAIDYLKDGGYFGFIAPSNWLTNAGASIFRNKILTEGEIIKFIDFGDFKVFQDAGIQTMIYIFQKEKPRKSYKVQYAKIEDKNLDSLLVAKFLASGLKIKIKGTVFYESVINPSELKDKPIVFSNNETGGLLSKIKTAGIYYLKKEDIGQGIVMPQEFVIKQHLSDIEDKKVKINDGIFVLMDKEVNQLNLNTKEKDFIKPYYTSRQISRYSSLADDSEQKIIYANKYFRENINLFPNLKAHLDKFNPVLTSDFAPYGLHRARDEKFFTGENIFSLRKTMRPAISFVDFPCYVSQSYFILKPTGINLKYLTALLNSKLIYFWLKHKGKKQGEQLQIDKEPLLDIPLVKASADKEEILVKMTDKMTELNQQLHDCAQNSEGFNKIKKEIEETDWEIDKIVYELYGFTEDEIEIIEKTI